MRPDYSEQGDRCDGSYQICPAVAGFCAARGEYSSAIPLLDWLERLGSGIVLLDGTEKINAINSAAQQLLQRDIHFSDDRSHHLIPGLVKRLLKEISASSVKPEKSWVSLQRSLGRPIAVFVFDLDETCQCHALVLIDLGGSLAPSPTVLRRMFKLTDAEINLALAIASGFGPCEFAIRTHVSRSTARSQLSSVFAKTDTRRQAELVALLARISLVPSSTFSTLNLN